MTRHGMGGRKTAALLRSMATCDHRPWKELATAHLSWDFAPTPGVGGVTGHMDRHCPWPIARPRLTFPAQPNS